MPEKALWAEVDKEDNWAIKVNDNWAIKVNEDVPRADWDRDEEDEEDFDPYARRSPEPGDLDFEVGQALRICPHKVEHLTDSQFKRRFWQVQAQKEEEKLEQMTPRERRQEVEAIMQEIQVLKKQVQSCLDRVGVLGNRVAYLICRD